MKRDLLSWRQANELMEQAERIQRNFLQIIADTRYLAPQGVGGTCAPHVNVVKTDQDWWVIAALPGAKANQIDIRVEGDQLIIAGARPLPACCTEGEITIWEIPLGRFERRLSLIPGVRFTIAETRFKDGLLITQLRKSL